MGEELPELVAPDAPAWRRWLARNHHTAPGVWLVLAKKGTVKPTSLSYEQALDEALCHGWIDGQVRRRDELTFRQRFTPRRERSAWSQRNVQHVTRLLEQGRMHAAGIAAVERAKQDGRWERAYAGAATIEMPPELAKALAAEPRASDAFARLSAQNRYAMLYRIGTLKRAHSRQRRAERYVEMLLAGETIHPQPPSEGA